MQNIDKNCVRVSVGKNGMNENLWDQLGLFGNFQEGTALMCPLGHLVVILPNLSNHEWDLLLIQLHNAGLVVDTISDEDLDVLRKHSPEYMAKFLKRENFFPPPGKQWHLLLPLCTHAQVNPDMLRGVCSKEKAKNVVITLGLYGLLWLTENVPQLGLQRR